MPALKIKYCHPILTPYNLALSFILFAHITEPYLFSQSLRDFLLARHYIYNSLACKMDFVNESEEPVKMSEGYHRYCRLHAIVDEVGKGPATRPQLWYDEHYHLLHLYDTHFENGFSKLHLEIEDESFRNSCEALDRLLAQLLREYETLRWFSLYDYMVFNMTMINVIDTVFERKDEDEITAMFGGLRV
jgi:hypothetical protein